jgi:hypothetical protein
MSISGKMLSLGFVVALTAISCFAATSSLPAKAATPACGGHCVSIFSKELGSYAAPGVVESVLGGQATVGSASILEPASASASSEDWMPLSGLVSDFYAEGLVSADVNSHYGSERATQLEYAPFGIGTGLCTGLATVAYQ